MKFSTKHITKWIQHPNHPEIAVEVKRLSRREMMAYFSEFQNYQVPVAIRDSLNGEVLRGANGDIAFTTVQKLPLDAMISILEKGIVSWKGFEDEDGLIEWSPDKIDLLFDDRLICDIPNENYGKLLNPDDSKSGTDKESREKMAFWRYLNKHIGQEDFDSDPKT